MMDAMMQTRSKSENFTHIFSYQNGAVTVCLPLILKEKPRKSFE